MEHVDPKPQTEDPPSHPGLSRPNEEASEGASLPSGPLVIDAPAAAQPLESLEHEGDEEAPAAAQLGASRYVMAGFFIVSIVAAFVIGRLISSSWGRLADTTWVQHHMVFLTQVGEEERNEYCTVFGGLIALGLALYAYRRPDIHQWTEEVASELAKVTWPDKAEVTNSTVVVLVTSAFATLYLALLDRFWGFLTNLVYGS